jgi:DNA-binding transcriptional regulator YhcF (GntR family)
MAQSDQRMKFTLEEEEYTIVFQSDGVTTDEILEHFIMFMKGCGYHEDSIYSSLQETIDEREALSKACALYDMDACKDLV